MANEPCRRFPQRRDALPKIGSGTLLTL